MTKKEEIKLPILSILFLVGAIFWNSNPPDGLNLDSWHLLISFIITIFGIITVAAPMSVIAFMAICTLVLTKTLTLKESLSGFSSSIAWLVVLAFFIAKGFIKTNLGKRIAYYLISKFGNSNLGLGYSLVLTEFILAPMIPSTSARGGGIIYPIAKSLANEYDKNNHGHSKVSAFLILLCFHTNVICCALFLTSMAGNPLMATLASNFGINLSWANWAIGSIVPGLINLIFLPRLLLFLIKPDNRSNSKIVATAREALIDQGNLSRNEAVMLLVFIGMLIMWIFSKSIGIDTTTTALIGFLALIIFKVISWDDVISEKSAWDTLIWFAILLMLSDFLAKYGIDKWLEENIRNYASNLNILIGSIILGLFYFYSHYLFASITARVTVMYSTFLFILTDLGLAPLPTALALAIFSNLSAGLTHYGINSAPIYFSSGYFTTSRWLKLGFIIASFNLIIWIVFGGLWWRVLGWI